MKARTLISISLISGLAAVAQTAPPSQRVAPDTAKSPMAKPAVTQQAKPAAPAPTQAKPATTTAKPMTTQSKPAMTPAKPAVSQAKPAMATPKKAPVATKAQAKPASKPVVTSAALKAPAKQAGKRDPFISPVREVGSTGPGCSTGKKCLAIDAIKLIGIVRAQSGSIALVGSSTTAFTYFLRESDPVFNGYVVRITPNSIIFRENVIDRMGKTSTRDITRTVSAPPV